VNGVNNAVLFASEAPFAASALGAAVSAAQPAAARNPAQINANTGVGNRFMIRFPRNPL
jgi:hypothetical protein